MPMVKSWLAQHPDWDQEVSLFIDDGKSAFKEDYQSRPSFCKILREARANRINRLWVESLDRWSRRVVDGLSTLQQAYHSGLTVVSMAEGETDWTHPQGWFRSLIALGMAEWASREKSWRVTQAMDRRRNNKKKICPSCGVVHLGRHPKTCQCDMCLARRKKK